MINFEYFFNLINIFRYIKLLSKFNFFTTLILFTNFFYIFSQEELNNINKSDSIKKNSNEVLLDKVRYNAKNYVKIDFFNQFLTDYPLMIFEFAYRLNYDY